jgi:hypothetical protein
LHFRLIHPVAGVVAEFTSAHAMIEFFMQMGRRDLPEGAEASGMLLQVSQGGLFFQEHIDALADSGPPSAAGVVLSSGSRRLQ